MSNTELESESESRLIGPRLGSDSSSDSWPELSPESLDSEVQLGTKSAGEEDIIEGRQTGRQSRVLWKLDAVNIEVKRSQQS